jgi:hypothetical protein
MTVPLIVLQILRDIANFYGEEYFRYAAELIVDFQGFFIFIVCVWFTKYRQVLLGFFTPRTLFPPVGNINEMQLTAPNIEYQTVTNITK